MAGIAWRAASDKIWIAAAGEKRIACDHECAIIAGVVLKGGVYIGRGACCKDLEPQPQSLSRGLRLPRLSGDTGVSRIGQHVNRFGMRHQLVQQLQHLRSQLGGNHGHPRDIAAGLIKINEAVLDGVVRRDKDDGYSSRCSLSRACCYRAGGGDDGHATMNQVRREVRQAIISALCPSIFNCDAAILGTKPNSATPLRNMSAV